MIRKWASKKEIVLRGMRIAPGAKLEGFRMMNELADKILSARQKFIRKKLKESQ